MTVAKKPAPQKKARGRNRPDAWLADKYGPVIAQNGCLASGQVKKCIDGNCVFYTFGNCAGENRCTAFAAFSGPGRPVRTALSYDRREKMQHFTSYNYRGDERQD